ncbi:hypothetical protein Baya_8466 [Bagarius yarrelli]|uniref:Uncharacterized protein n=1 Tax=Bagarius yarrelli TaxID=175774 RepID=A0A556U5Q7_BAGYA|nr:hypothetical protein Baya_8466 [Bagarius yarrelli]
MLPVDVFSKHYSEAQGAWRRRAGLKGVKPSLNGPKVAPRHGTLRGHTVFTEEEASTVAPPVRGRSSPVALAQGPRAGHLVSH